MSRSFNRPVEYDPSLFRAAHPTAHSATNGYVPQHQYLSREQVLKSEFGLDAEDEAKEEEDAANTGSSDISITPSGGHGGHGNTSDIDATVDSDEELERLTEQVQLAREAQSRAELSAQRAEARVDELQRMTKQAKTILVKQFKDQITGLLTEIEDQKQMLAEDDETIATLRQALARYEFGDQAAAQEVQGKIREERDSRELKREIGQLKSQLQTREKQLLDMKDELTRVQSQSQASCTQASPRHNQNDEHEKTAKELQSAQRRVLELAQESKELESKLLVKTNEVAEAKLRINELTTQQQSQTQAQSAPAVSMPVIDAMHTAKVTAEVAEFRAKTQQLEEAIKAQREMAEAARREADETRAALAATVAEKQTIIAQASSAATTREQSLEQQLSLSKSQLAELGSKVGELDAALNARDAELLSVKDKAKEKLLTASESIKKLKSEYSNLRAAYNKQKLDGSNEALTLRKELEHSRSVHQKVLGAMDETLSGLRDECHLLRQQCQSMPLTVTQSLSPYLTRHLNALMDHYKAETASLTASYRKELALRKSLFNQLQELKGNIRVFCRVRPLSTREREASESSITFADSDTDSGDGSHSLTIQNPEKKSSNTFEFEQVFAPASTQDEVFAEISDLVTSVMDGFNVCIFAYGQTGSGKTFTMQGSKEDPGVNIRTLNRLFAIAAERALDTDYDIKISLLEIYNEKIQDLLSPQGSVALKASQTKDGMVVQDLTYVSVSSPSEVLVALANGSKNRKVSSTAMNSDSSRSHLILSVYVGGKSKFGAKSVLGKMHLIDLAGSERISRSGVTGEGLKEAQAINSSLSALGNVIAARANKQTHVPYRDSTLTYLLQDSLEKNSKTLMFVQVSPNLTDVSESICSLRFAERVRKVEMGKASANVKK